MPDQMLSRRRLLALGAATATGMALPARAQLAQPEPSAAQPSFRYSGEIAEDTPADTARRNIQSFRTLAWQDHFDTLTNGAILCDVASRALHYWAEDGQTYLLFPCSVPMTEDFTRRGRTEITMMRPNPVWIPTPSMRARDPGLPARVDAGPENPMGTRAMNLTWQYYRIHGIDNPAKIGRKASNGCFGLYNHHVEDLFERCRVGTQVVVI